jgi:hypothetical protein
VDTKVVRVDMSKRRVADLTGDVEIFCGGKGDGLCSVFVSSPGKPIRGHSRNSAVPGCADPAFGLGRRWASGLAAPAIILCSVFVSLCSSARLVFPTTQ